MGGDGRLGPPELHIPALLGALAREQPPERLAEEADEHEVEDAEDRREDHEVGGHQQHLRDCRQHGDHLHAERPPPALDVGGRSALGRPEDPVEEGHAVGPLRVLGAAGRHEQQHEDRELRQQLGQGSRRVLRDDLGEQRGDHQLGQRDHGAHEHEGEQLPALANAGHERAAGSCQRPGQLPHRLPLRLAGLRARRLLALVCRPGWRRGRRPRRPAGGPRPRP